MTTKHDTGSSYTVRLNRADVTHTEDGHFLVPVLLDDGVRQTPAHLRIERNAAARLHAQLDRLLGPGWARSEPDMVARQSGEIPVSSHTRWRNSMNKPEIVVPWFNVSSNTWETCVDMQKLADGTVQIRNSTRPDGAVIDYTAAEWATFIQGVKDGKVDHTL